MFETMASFMLVEHANGAMFDPRWGPRSTRGQLRRIAAPLQTPAAPLPFPSISTRPSEDGDHDSHSPGVTQGAGGFAAGAAGGQHVIDEQSGPAPECSFAACAKGAANVRVPS